MAGPRRALGGPRLPDPLPHAAGVGVQTCTKTPPHHHQNGCPAHPWPSHTGGPSVPQLREDPQDPDSAVGESKLPLSLVPKGHDVQHLVVSKDGALLCVPVRGPFASRRALRSPGSPPTRP